MKNVDRLRGAAAGREGVPKRTRAAMAALVAVVLLLGGGRLAQADPSSPRLAVLIVVDQLRRDRVDASLPGGIGRLVREGRSYPRGELAHATAETCPGHAALATGRHPGPAGLPLNYSIDRESGVSEYCLEDEAEAAGVLHAAAPVGRSPRRMRVEALGDWLQLAHPEARVLAVSAKDRAAIALGGQHPTAAYWLLRDARLGFTTSRYYAPELPSWVREWNGWGEGAPGSRAVVDRVPERWRHAAGVAEAVDPRRPDDYPYENDQVLGRVSGRPLRGASMAETGGRLYRSPFVDQLTLDFADRAAQELGLGADEVPDLLAVSLSATDTVGHEFGPESHEARDALLRLDAWLGDWLSALEERVGRGRLVVALSSDHGVLAIPEWLVETGRSRCPVAPARVDLDALRAQLDRDLDRRLRRWYQWPSEWLYHSGLQITVDRAHAARRDVPVDRIVSEAEAWLEARPEIAAAWTSAELADGGDPMAVRYRRSYDEERSGDLVAQPAADCLVARYPAGTSHGTPYAYDREVPIVLWGAGVPPGSDEREAATVDVAPTLAELLGIEAPRGLDGSSLLD